MNSATDLLECVAGGPPHHLAHIPHNLRVVSAAQDSQRHTTAARSSSLTGKKKNYMAKWLDVPYPELLHLFHHAKSRSTASVTIPPSV
jgi:hypothetical protein